MTERFASADEAWFWAWDTFLALALGLPPRRGARHPARPCGCLDIIIPVMSAAASDSEADMLAVSGRAGYWPGEPPLAMGKLAALLAQRGWSRS